MSLENRDKIRPLGVWSKYVSGACKMPINSALWQLIDATKQPKRTNSSANTDVNAASDGRIEKKKETNRKTWKITRKSIRIEVRTNSKSKMCSRYRKKKLQLAESFDFHSKIIISWCNLEIVCLLALCLNVVNLSNNLAKSKNHINKWAYHANEMKIKNTAKKNKWTKNRM